MNDFKAEYLRFENKIDDAIKQTLKSGWYILGKKVSEFENNFAKHTGTKYCIGVANGLDALQIALMALGVGKGDEVITVSNSAVATALAISNIGATPVFADIDEYFHMDPLDLEKKITKNTKAVVPVHLFGQVADMGKIRAVARKYKLYVIEDACQAHGASIDGKRAGSMGVAGCFSFYPTKNLGGYGDGGAITTDSIAIFKKCLMLRNYGQKTRYIHLLKGVNSRLDELQAAILNVKLSHLGRFVKLRNIIAMAYLKQLKDVKQITLPRIRKGSFHSFHLFVIRVKKRNALREYLKGKGIETQIHYPIPIHKQECYREFNGLSLPLTEKTAKEILSLPLHPTMGDGDVAKVCLLIKDFYKNEN